MTAASPADPRRAFVTSDPGRLFSDVAASYARYRPAYAPAAFQLLRERFGLDGTQSVLDLGAGTGNVAVPLAPSVRRIVAVDPSEAMLGQLARQAIAAGVGNVEVVIGDSRDLPVLNLGSFDLVTMGSSFHWMDRAAILEVLNGVVAASGGIVVLGNHRSGSGWSELTRKVRERFSAAVPAGGGRVGVFDPSGIRELHDVVLGRSPFSHVEASAFAWTVRRSVHDTVESALTYSANTPAVLGEHVAAFRSALTAELEAIAEDGMLEEPISTEVLIATRG